MKKLYIPLFLAAGLCAAAAGCAKDGADYADYVSEERYDVFMYSGDGDELKIYCSHKESPFSADGVKGRMNDLVEVYCTFENSYEEVTISSESFTGGEASYLSTRNCWYLSFSGSLDADSVTVTATCDGKENSYTLLSVATDGVMSASRALECVVEYDGQTFEALTQNGTFCGEIFLRLLYDDKCYWYAGVCDRNGKIKAYLLDGETGRIIAEREHTVK